MSRSNRFGGVDIIIKKLVLQQTGTFHDVYNRSFEMHLDDNSLNSLRNRIEQAGQGRITRQSFRGMSSSILVPTAEVDPTRDRIHVPDGWDRARCRFMMEVDVTSNLGEQSTYFFQGFSDHLGLTRTGNIDDKMVFYINGFIRVQKVTRSGRNGSYEVGVVKESAQIIDGKLIFDRNRDTYMARTVDLYSNMQERFFDTGFVEKLDDSRTTLQSPIDSIFARRIDNLPGEYLSSTLDNYRRNTDILQFGTDRGDVLARTQQVLNSDLLNMQDNPVLTRLAQIQGTHTSTSFTIKDLMDLDPEVVRGNTIEGTVLSNKALEQLAYHGNDVSDWRAPTVEAIWATQIATSLAAIMMSNYYRVLDFTVDNMNINNEIKVTPLDSLAYAENMPRQIFERMLDQVEDLFFDISGGNIDNFEVMAKASQYDQTEIFVSVNNAPEQRFFVPSFADSLLSPFYTRDRSRLTNLSTDLESILNDVHGEISGSSSALTAACNV